MRSRAECFGTVQLLLCLTLVGCHPDSDIPSPEDVRESRRHILEPDVTGLSTEPDKADVTHPPAQKFKPPRYWSTPGPWMLVGPAREIVETYMTDWTCDIPDVQVGEFSNPIENEAQWMRLWTRWQPDKPVPNVCFESSLVYCIVRDTGDRNHRSVKFVRRSDGSIQHRGYMTGVLRAPTDREEIHFYILPRK